MPTYVIQVFEADDPSENALTIRVEADSPEEAIENAHGAMSGDPASSTVDFEIESEDGEEEADETVQVTRDPKERAL